MERGRDIVLYALAIIASGVLAAGSPASFATAAVFSLLAAWIAPPLLRRPAKEVSVMLDTLRPATSMLADGIQLAMRSAHGVPTALRIQTPAAGNYIRYSIDLGRKGDVRLICAGKRPASLGFPGEWIADHPLPLALPNGRPVTLFFAPAGGNRVRVGFARPRAPAPWFWLSLAGGALAFFVLDWTIPLAAVLASAAGVWITQQNKE